MVTVMPRDGPASCAQAPNEGALEVARERSFEWDPLTSAIWRETLPQASTDSQRTNSSEPASGVSPRICDFAILRWVFARVGEDWSRGFVMIEGVLY